MDSSIIFMSLIESNGIDSSLSRVSGRKVNPGTSAGVGVEAAAGIGVETAAGIGVKIDVGPGDGEGNGKGDGDAILIIEELSGRGSTIERLAGVLLPDNEFDTIESITEYFEFGRLGSTLVDLASIVFTNGRIICSLLVAIDFMSIEV